MHIIVEIAIEIPNMIIDQRAGMIGMDEGRKTTITSTKNGAGVMAGIPMEAGEGGIMMIVIR